MKRKLRSSFTVILFLAAAGLCLYGAMNGEMAIVWAKAARICMECIGLG